MATAAAIDLFEGLLPGDAWFHLDVGNDVLYLRNAKNRDQPVVGEETSDGLTRLTTGNGSYAGLTVTGFWRRYGEGGVQSATLASTSDLIARWANTHAHQK